MRITKRNLISLINEEKRRIDEACGCGDVGSEEMPDIRGIGRTAPQAIEDEVYDDYTQDEVVTNRFLTREEALKAVTAIAMVSTCPVTERALLTVVQELM